MADLLGVTVEELVGILKRKKARVPFEIGAFVALEATEALMNGPAKIGIREVRIADDGSVSVFAPPNSASNPDAAKSVVRVLAHLLVAAGPGVPPVLLELVESGPSDGKWDLSRLRDELEASLVPLNRQAARRVLSRMIREASRDGGMKRSSLPPPPKADDMDAALDGLLGGAIPPPANVPSAAPSPAPASPPVDASKPRILYAPEPIGDSRQRGDQVWSDERPTAPQRRQDDSSSRTLDRGLPPSAVVRADPSEEYDFESQETLVKDGSVPPPPMAPPSRQADFDTDALLDELAAETGLPSDRDPTPVPAVQRHEPAPAVDRYEPGQMRRRDVDLSGLEEVTLAKQGRGIWWALVFLLLSAGLLVGVALLRPDAVDRFLGNETPEEREHRRLEEERNNEQARLLGEHAERFGNLGVDVSVERAQVFLYVGRGPAVVENLPLGVAHEFVVIAEGKAPSRAVVPADASYEATDEGPLYELPVQGGAEDMSFEDLVLGDTTLEPGAMGAPTGETGRVRVVTAPREAKVYQLIGFTPGVGVQNQRTDQPVELLVWAEGHRAERAVVGPSDWAGEGENRSASITIDLTPLEGFEPEE